MNQSGKSPEIGAIVLRVVCALAAALSVGYSAVWTPAVAAAEAATLKDCDGCPELVRVGPGSFQMGSPADEKYPPAVPESRIMEERPAHPVSIGYSFAIGRHEITVGEFARFAEATKFEEKGCYILVGKQWQFDPAADWRRPGFQVSDRHPATCLSYDDFSKYLAWLSSTTGKTYRFPTEAEWEYVARLGQVVAPALDEQACRSMNGADASFKRRYAADWGPGLYPCDDGAAAAGPVASYSANGLAMYDVLGNLSEWTQDCSGYSHEGAPTDGSAHTHEICPAHVLKGGSWAGGPGFLRPAIRGGFPMILRGDGHGLRVVREL